MTWHASGMLTANPPGAKFPMPDWMRDTKPCSIAIGFVRRYEPRYFTTFEFVITFNAGAGRVELQLP